jgi:hypothetical protein
MSCMFKGCKTRFKTVVALRTHWSAEHECDHAGCEVKSKNAVAGKEHSRDKHGPQCHVHCEGENYSVVSAVAEATNPTRFPSGDHSRHIHWLVVMPHLLPYTCECSIHAEAL